MCRSLAESGHEVFFVCASGAALRNQLVTGVIIKTADLPTSRLERMWRTTQGILTQAQSLGGDIYHFHDPDFLPLAVSFQERTRAPVVYDVHEDYRVHMAKPWLPKLLQGIASRGVGYFEDKVSPHLAGVVAATPHIAKQFKGHSNLAVVQNFPKLEEFDYSVSTNHARTKSFVYVGGITRGRGILQMVQALSTVESDCELRLAGAFRSKDLRSCCRELNGWDKVRELGYLRRAGVKRTLAHAQCGLVLYHPCPNNIHSYPTKFFEYMATGLPVIASDFPLWRSIIEGAGCGLLVDPLDPQAIADAMQWVLDHPVQAEAMGRRGREAVEQKYNWECEFEKLKALYERLLSGGWEAS